MSKGWACIARLGGIGDNLIAASPLHALKRMGYMTEVISSTPFHVVYLNNPNIDKLSVKDSNRDLPQGDMLKWQAWFESRAHEYDLFGHFSHTCEGRHALFPSSTSFWWPAEYRRKLCAGSYLETVHDIMGVPYEFGPLFYATDEEDENALSVKKQAGPRVLGWVISGTRIDKMYPYAAYAISRIIKEFNIPVMLFGAPNDKEYSSAEMIKAEVERTNGTREGLFSACQSPQIPEEQRWGIRPALTLLQNCDVVVSPDTGPAWAVAMEPMPKVIMVSHTSVENITKHWKNTTTLHADPDRVPCWPCHRLHDGPETCVTNKEGNGAACISDISVERLVQVVAESWGQGRGSAKSFKATAPQAAVHLPAERPLPTENENIFSLARKQNA